MIKYLIKYLLALCFALCSSVTHAEILVNATTTKVDLSSCFYYSTSAYPDIADIPAREDITSAWQPIPGNSINFGFVEDTYWFVCDFSTGELTSENWILEQAYPLVDSLDVYFFKQGELVKSWLTGDMLPFVSRPIDHEHFLFPLHLQPDTTYRILIKASNSEAMELPIKLYEAKRFAIDDRQKSMVNGIFIGFLLIMAAYNLGLYLNIREKSYLYYVTYVVGMLLFFLGQDGIIYQYLLPGFPVAHYYSIPLTLSFTAFGVLFFVSHFMNLKKHNPTGWLIARWLVALNVIALLSVAFSSYTSSIHFIFVGIAALSICGIALIIQMSLKGYKTAQILLSGWFILMIFVIFALLSKLGILYNEVISNYGLKIGTTIEILVFSFALSYRINQEREKKERALELINAERKERIEAQEKALRYEEEAHKAKDMALTEQRKLNESLEHLVSERTEQLEKLLKDLEKSNRELAILGETDVLTQIFNRRAFDQKAVEVKEASIQSDKPFSLLLIDADHFKAVNDNRGHQCGDYVLIELAKLITRCATRPTDMAFRYGGEEFLLLLPNTTAKGASHVAEVLRSSAEQCQMTWEHETFNVTLSIGVHTFNPATDEDLEAIIAKADAALYQAKETGRNKVVSTDTIDKTTTTTS